MNRKDAASKAQVRSRFETHGATLAGALSSAAVSAMSGDPAVALTGSLVGATLTAALSEASAQKLSRREKERIGALAILASSRLRQMLGEGAKLRGDDFIRSRVDGRSPADEVIEHGVIAARTAYEERKLPFLANALAHIAVSEWIDETTAHWVLSTLESMSWSKLVALALVDAHETAPLPDTKVVASAASWQPWSMHNVFAELSSTHNLIGRHPRQIADSEGMPDFSDYFSDYRLTPGGKMLFWSAGLEGIQSDDRAVVMKAIVDDGAAESASN